MPFTDAKYYPIVKFQIISSIILSTDYERISEICPIDKWILQGMCVRYTYKLCSVLENQMKYCSFYNAINSHLDFHPAGSLAFLSIKLLGINVSINLGPGVWRTKEFRRLSQRKNITREACTPSAQECCTSSFVAKFFQMTSAQSK